MTRRTAQAALMGLLMSTGSLAAKPPGPPADPHVSGRELTPIEREFHETVAVRLTSNFRPADFDRSAKPLPFSEWLDWLRLQFEYGITIPLGTVEVPE